MAHDGITFGIKALIGRRLGEPLTLADIAAASGFSPFHLSRLFAMTEGEGVMAFVRRRRLELAADRLRLEPALRLIDLAFDSGFESQEAFTRAFKRFYGAAPGRFRRGRAPLPGAYA